MLDAIDLELAPGETVAVVGPSGSGKARSQLLLKLVEPTAGRIKVGSLDLALCDSQAWRELLAWLPQRPTLFRASIADNVRLGDPRGRRARAPGRGARGRRGLHPRSRGCDTVVGEGGRALSAGELQRVALASASTPIVLLDEPTANLDSESAEIVADAVERLRADRTVLLPSTSPSWRRADRVVRLAAGRIVELAAEAADARDPSLGPLPNRPGGRWRSRSSRPRWRSARGRADDLGRLPHLACRGAAAHPLADHRDRRRRFFGLARPLARYCERVVSHDAALRALATIRSVVLRANRALAPAQLRQYRSGELLARMVGDVDAPEPVRPRLGPPIVALLVGAASVAVAAAVLPAAGAILAVGLLLAGLVVPLAGSALSRAASRRQAGVRGQLTTELVEVLRGAPELVAYGRGGDTAPGARSRS